MKSRWREADAEACVARYAEQRVDRDLALRVYTTRLLGRDPALVLHGGGNTSVKTIVTDALGEGVPVICVKGSGWDMANIEPEGLPAVRLEPLRRLQALKALSDEEMVNLQRCNLLDGGAPNPSVETLLHAFLPGTYVDHTHANAVLAVTDQADGGGRAAELYRDTMAVVPYIMPGFALAKTAAEVFQANPNVEGLILLKHGIFTLGETAREAYERMIAKVSEAQAYLRRGRRSVFAAAPLPKRIAAVAEVAPILRGLTSLVVDETEGTYRRLVLAFRSNKAALDYVNGAELRRYANAGVATPDHAIRTKDWPLIVPAPAAGELEAFRREAKAAVEAYMARYRAYFGRNNNRHGGAKKPLDPMPRVILVPGLGLFGLGASAKEARIAADIAEATVAVVTGSEAVGRFESISEEEMFDVEYWSLEQAKLGRQAEKPLARQVVVVTGGARGIGAATVAAFAAEGAEVALLDRDEEGARRTAATIGGATLAVGCDVTERDAVKAAFDRVCAAFGGVDIVVSNAGAPFDGKIGEVPDSVLRESFELNFFAHQTVARNAVRIMRAQGLGGVLLFNASKQAVNPGLDFGPYGLAKAATLFLSRQYALDHGAEGIRSNAVNADRVATGMFSGDLLERRAKARGMTVSEYLTTGNLLRREVKADDVARAFVHLALAPKTTAAVVTVDGGNIAAALR
ncbi:MAG: bifunctional aldolase/short-chain dehydrogenase [Alphaproteobacteria bacterium]